MTSSPSRDVEPGREPWDPANGLRVGILAGGVVGAVVAVVSGVAHFWVVALGGVIGGGIGWWSERRKQPRR
ncbi:MAG: hypothetical protein OEV40_02840 [Acidimicrobiia bacterium]|nr:hypothetical protein [Acidimicrobiia bacterium]